VMMRRCFWRDDEIDRLMALLQPTLQRGPAASLPSSARRAAASLRWCERALGVGCEHPAVIPRLGGVSK
jgi:hypothetical protein